MPKKCLYQEGKPEELKEISKIKNKKVRRRCMSIVKRKWWKKITKLTQQFLPSMGRNSYCRNKHNNNEKLSYLEST